MRRPAVRRGFWCLAPRALVFVAAAAAAIAQAQPARDPTLPPASATRAPAADASGRPPVPDIGPVAVIVREGKPYLVVGTRLYAQGQTIGDSRIERITETEVWLREGKTLHRKPIFSGIVRSASGTAPGPAPGPIPLPPANPAGPDRRR